VLAQTYPAKEIIVVDDGSTDNTALIKHDFPQIIYICQKNRGVSSARNLGIKHCASNWIAFLDSDDEWHPTKLAKQVLFHKKNPDILMSYTDELWIRDAQEIKVPKKFKKYGGEIFDKCLSHCIIAPSSVFIHKELFDEIGMFDEDLEVCEDYDLWLRVAYENKIGLVEEKLITKYAGHDDQLSFKHWGMDRFRVQALEKLIRLIGCTTLVVPSEHTKVKSEAKATHPKRATVKSEAKAIHPKELVIQELIKKYTMLHKGAIKYDRIHDVKIYEKKLKELTNESN
jgi:glycosyltransferase involved in cell wall biosynthesis